MNFDYTIFIHRLYFNENAKKGGLDLFIDYFQQTRKRVLIVEIPLDYSQNNLIKVTGLDDSGGFVLLQQLKVPLRINVINWFFEFFICIFLAVKFKAKESIVISSDPLTTLPALFLRKINFFKMHYYHSVDYSTERFKNKILNNIYKILLIAGIRYADLVGVVTKHAKNRLAKYRKKPIVFVPNSPDYDFTGVFRKNISVKIKNSLVVTCANVSEKFCIMEMLELLIKLRKFIPDISLHVIGYFDPDEPYCRDLERFVSKHDLHKNVNFYSQVPRETNLELISRMCVGLAFYSPDVSHVRFGDSLKIREYAALGLPCISDDKTQTSEEMVENNAGYAVKSILEAFALIQQLLTDSAKYVELSLSALNWAKKMDKKLIMERITRESFK